MHLCTTCKIKTPLLLYTEVNELNIYDRVHPLSVLWGFFKARLSISLGQRLRLFVFVMQQKMKLVKILQFHLPVCFAFKKLFNLQKLIWISQHPISAGYNGLKEKEKVHGLFHGLRVSQTWVWIPSPLSTGYEILEKFFNFSKSCIFLILRLTINFTELLGRKCDIWM